MRNEKIKSLQEQVEIYNNTFPGDSIMLVPKMESVDNLYICCYNEGQIGLFEKLNYHTPIREVEHTDHCFQAGSIYIGKDSKEIGIVTTHNGWFELLHLEKEGFCAFCGGNYYIATCNIEKVVSFDNVRLLMYHDGKIEKYISGKATVEEMFDVLAYAQSSLFKKANMKRL